jgi:membrane peptidoglycan carboxypeptidase
VWMGNRDAQIPMDNVHGIKVTGGSFPAIMWQKFMNTADRDYPEEQFAKPEVQVTWDPFFISTYAVPPTSSSTISTTTTTIPGTNPSDGLPPDITAPPTTTTGPPQTSF